MAGKPMMLGDAVGRLSMEIPTNQAVSDLAYDFKAQAAVDGVLRSWGQTRFEPLIGVNSKSQISMPLYAGDGLIAKITPARYEGTALRPYVLPPIQRKTVEAGYTEFHVQMFPFVATGSVTNDDVEIMRDLLDKAGYRFANGDDRPDNLGRMPGGQLCIIDCGAIEPKPGHRPKHDEADEWLARVHETYGPLYGGEGVKRQSEATKFDRRPAPPAMTLHKNFNAQNPAKPAANRDHAPVWQRILGFGR